MESIRLSIFSTHGRDVQEARLFELSEAIDLVQRLLSDETTPARITSLSIGSESSVCIMYHLDLDGQPHPGGGSFGYALSCYEGDHELFCAHILPAIVQALGANPELAPDRFIRRVAVLASGLISLPHS